MRFCKKIYYAFVLTLITAHAVAQNIDVSMQPANKLPLSIKDSLAKLLVRNIIVKGNKRTRAYMILREIQFKAGDSIIVGELNAAFQLARQQVYNTTLFHEVKVDLAMVTAYEIDVTVTVRERWYIWPAPQFQVVDRSFNEWLVKYKGDLSRVNYGIKFVHYNFSGRRDPLRLFLINGYTKNIAFSYSQPYSNKALTQGFGIGGGYAENREIAYKTSYDNKILFFRNKDFVRKNIYANISLRLQKGILYRHQFGIAYSRLTVSDSVVSVFYNPSYFNTNTTSKGLIDFTYAWQYTNVNNGEYPLKGTTSYIRVLKRGLAFTGGTNLFSIDASYNKYLAHARNWFSSFELIGNIKLPFSQPYLNQRAIGYGDATLRGLEFYVVDGVAFGIAKATLKKKVISFKVPMPFKTRLIPTLPFTIFAKTYADAGFAYNKKQFDAYLNNRLLYTAGFGIDILTLYDMKLRLEYSFNQLHKNAFFFESK